MLDPEGVSTVIPRNSGNYLPVDTAQLPRIFEVSANKLHNRCSSLCMVNSISTVWFVWDGVRGGVLIKRHGMYCCHWTVISLVGGHCDGTNIEFCINAELHMSWVISWGVFLAETAIILALSRTVSRKKSTYVQNTAKRGYAHGRAEWD